MIPAADYVIIGGGIAGITAAETIREMDKFGSIAVFSDEPHLLYSRVLLPSYLKGRIKREQVFMRTISDFDVKDIRVFVGEEAVKVDPALREIRLKSGVRVGYRKLLIAAGGRVRSAPFAVADYRQIFRLQTLDDADRLYRSLAEINHALVAGGGFIALEFLDILAAHKKQATLLIKEPRFFAEFISAAGSAVLAKNFENRGIEVIADEEAAGIEGNGGVITGVATSKGRVWPCDAVCVGIGIRRNVEFLKDSGVAVGETGVLVNEFLETSAPDIYGAGDVAELTAARGASRVGGNWHNAFMQGKAVGRAMAGARTPFKPLPQYSISNLGLHIAMIGEVGITDGAESVTRQAVKPLFYEEWFLRQGKIVGAFLINAARHGAVLQQWILEEKNVADRLALFQDPAKEYV